MRTVLRFALILCTVNLAAASILAGVYHLTKPHIERQERLIREEALREVMPESVGGRIEAVEEAGEIESWKVFEGAGHRATGYVFIAEKYGYSGMIETMVGVKADGTITGVRILSQNETPGLGAKIVEVVRDKTLLKALKGIFSKDKEPKDKVPPYFTEQFKGLDIKKLDISDIDAITGATISSKAAVDSIRSRGMEILNAR